MPLPFKSTPKQTYIPIGDEAIGIFHFPQKWSLSPNETILIEEATKDHKGYQKSILDFSGKLLKKWKAEIKEADLEVDEADLGNSILRRLNQLDLSDDPGKAEQQIKLDDFVSEKFEDKDSKALQTTLESIKKEADITKNAYVQAAMIYRFDDPDWGFDWGTEIQNCPYKGWSLPLSIEVYQQMRREEAGPQYDESGNRIKHKKEIVSDEEFKGFTPESVKKPQQEETQRELIGAVSTG